MDKGAWNANYSQITKTKCVCLSVCACVCVSVCKNMSCGHHDSQHGPGGQERSEGELCGPLWASGSSALHQVQVEMFTHSRTLSYTLPNIRTRKRLTLPPSCVCVCVCVCVLQDQPGSCVCNSLQSGLQDPVSREERQINKVCMVFTRSTPSCSGALVKLHSVGAPTETIIESSQPLARQQWITYRCWSYN